MIVTNPPPSAPSRSSSTSAPTATAATATAASSSSMSASSIRSKKPHQSQQSKNQQRRHHHHRHHRHHHHGHGHDDGDDDENNNEKDSESNNRKKNKQQKKKKDDGNEDGDERDDDSAGSDAGGHDEDDDDEDDDDEALDEFDTDDDFLVGDNEFDDDDDEDEDEDGKVDKEEEEEPHKKPTPTTTTTTTTTQKNRKRKREERQPPSSSTVSDEPANQEDKTTEAEAGPLKKEEELEEPSLVVTAPSQQQEESNQQEEAVAEDEDEENDEEPATQRKRPKKRLTRLVKRRDLVSPSEILELREQGRRFDDTAQKSALDEVHHKDEDEEDNGIATLTANREQSLARSITTAATSISTSDPFVEESEAEPRTASSSNSTANRRLSARAANLLDLSMAGLEDDDEEQFERRGAAARSGRNALLREVREIFGDDIDFDNLEVDNEQQEDEDEESVHGEEDEDDLLLRDEADEEARELRLARRRAGKALQLRDQFEPDVLKEKFFTETDEQIQKTDIPERLQLAHGANRDVPTELDLNEEAGWIYDNAFKPYLPELSNLDVEMRDVGDGAPKTAIPLNEEMRRDAFVKTISAVLTHLIVKHFDVPFIAYYRQEYFVDVLHGELDLWTIFDWDLKWMRLTKRKRDIQLLLRRLLEHLARNPLLVSAKKEAAQRLEQLYSPLLDNSVNMEEIVDLSDYINLYFAQELQQQQQRQLNQIGGSTSSTTRRPLRRDLYSGLTRDGLDPLKDRFGFTAGKYADNLDAGYVRHPVVDDAQDPIDAAFDFITDTRNDEQALAAARLMLAIEISTEPVVRSKLRLVYDWNAKIRATPTKKGQGIRRIEELCTLAAGRPIKWFWSREPQFDVGQQQQQQQQQPPQPSIPILRFLEIMKSELDGLLTVKFEIPEDVLEQCLETKTYLLSDKTSSRVRLWNEQREAVMTLAVQRLRVVMEQYLRRRYTTEAQEWVALLCEQELFRLAISGPYGMHRAHLKDNHQDQLRPELMSTLIACQGSETEPTTFVFIDVDGQVVDHLQWIVPNTPFNQRTRPREVQEQRDLLKGFIRRHEPDIIAVGVNGMSSRRLFMDMSLILEEMKQDTAGTSSASTPGDRRSAELDNQRDNNADEDDEYDRLFRDSHERSRSRERVEDRPELEQGYNISAIKVVWVPEDVARVFEVSTRARNELPDLTGIMRRAVSIGRRLQDPLTEVAGLCNESMDVLSLRLHRLRDAVPRDVLVTHAERALVRAVNAVGVDINRMISRKHTATVLPFLSGLGPRKAQYMLTRIAQLPGAHLLARKDLLEEHITDKVVFKNCVGFIRITYYTATDPDLSTKDVLEETRIHPEAYILTVKMCTDAIECEDDPDTQQLAVERVMSDPRRLDELDLDAYAAALAQLKEYGRMEVTLRNIRNELQRPFRDPRGDFCPLTDDELFELMTGETDETLHSGIVVSAVITRVGPRGFSVRLSDSELFGFVPINCADSAEQLQIGQGVLCVVTGIDKKAYSVTLDARSSVVLPLTAHGGEAAASGADAVASPSARMHQQRRQQLQQQKRRLHQRQIDYPYFENVDYDGAINRLQDKPVGELVVRPSRKGDDHLSITFKFFGDKYINVDVQERDKKDRFSLGQRLFIAKQEFQSLDHIEVEYVTAMVEKARKLMDYKYYVDETKEQIEATLRREKGQNRRSIPYRIALHPDHPGKFIIYYLLGNTRIKHDSVTITAHGFEFHRKEYNGVSKLINAFKRYVQDSLRLRMSQHADDA